MKKQTIHFIVPFNKRKQSFEVVIYSDSGTEEFNDAYKAIFGTKHDNQTVAFYAEKTDRYIRTGPFGVIHILKDYFTLDTVVHECVHLLVDWMKARHMRISDRNEERVAYLFDEITRNFWVEYHRAKTRR